MALIFAMIVSSGCVRSYGRGRQGGERFSTLRWQRSDGDRKRPRRWGLDGANGVVRSDPNGGFNFRLNRPSSCGDMGVGVTSLGGGGFNKIC
jgi:hypothetical protein